MLSLAAAVATLVATRAVDDFVAAMGTSTPQIVIEPRFRIRLGRHFELGPGKAELLELIETAGSTSAAARVMNMSYMRAWTLVKSLGSGSRERWSRPDGEGGLARAAPPPSGPRSRWQSCARWGLATAVWRCAMGPHSTDARAGVLRPSLFAAVGDVSAANQPTIEEHVNALEAEVHTLRAENRDLRLELGLEGKAGLTVVNPAGRAPVLAACRRAAISSTSISAERLACSTATD